VFFRGGGEKHREEIEKTGLGKWFDGLHFISFYSHLKPHGRRRLTGIEGRERPVDSTTASFSATGADADAPSRGGGAGAGAGRTEDPGGIRDRYPTHDSGRQGWGVEGRVWLSRGEGFVMVIGLDLAWGDKKG